MENIPVGASIFAGFGLGSPECVLLASGLCLSGGCVDPGLLSGLLVLEDIVSLVVTCTLSVRRSSTALLERWTPEAVLLCPPVDVDGCGDGCLLGSDLSLRLPPCCPEGARGCVLPLSVAVLRSLREGILAWDEDDIIVTFVLDPRSYRMTSE